MKFLSTLNQGGKIVVNFWAEKLRTTKWAPVLARSAEVEAAGGRGQPEACFRLNDFGAFAEMAVLGEQPEEKNDRFMKIFVLLILQ
jgi:hypothetical protein